MHQKLWLVGIVALCLSACGGEGETTGSVQVVVPDPNEVLRPPSVSPSYLSARNFTEDRTYNDFGTRIETFSPYRDAGTPIADPAPRPTLVSLDLISDLSSIGMVGFVYKNDPKSYDVLYRDERRKFTQIKPNQYVGYTGDMDYDPGNPNPSHAYFRLVEKDLKYVGVSYWTTSDARAIENGVLGTRYISRVQLFGEPTLATDLPRGAGKFALRLPGLAEYFLARMDFGTGEISGSARVACPTGETCPTGDLGEVTLNGRFDGARRFLGTIGGSAGFTGTFVGRFYGPAAAEVGMVGVYHHGTRPSSAFYATSDF